MNQIQEFTEFRGQSKRNAGPSDLLLPKHLEEFLRIKLRKHGNLKNYFHYLIVKFQKKNLFSKFPDTAFRKTLYQSKRQNLIRISFRPDHQDWYEAKLAGFYFGVSICKLFSRLVDTDRDEGFPIPNWKTAILKLEREKVRPIHFYFTILSNKKMILKRLSKGQNFELNTA
ncbi:hypothetical protein A0128_14745 [Leptospira tipperaryensis]|uniref:PF07600 family protein n=1 Tax=Leptospira tipperaryensis TaxID=2564040 RepID=A0A1D7UZH4_9LEPT|nr:DUF1564 family protein [Leptospira tipperaryensis]AOP34995.1 hypothetical protein A0128_14745 [Leptospira tipperaryensis]